MFLLPRRCPAAPGRPAPPSVVQNGPTPPPMSSWRAKRANLTWAAGVGPFWTTDGGAGRLAAPGAEKMFCLLHSSALMPCEKKKTHSNYKQNSRKIEALSVDKGIFFPSLSPFQQNKLVFLLKNEAKMRWEAVQIIIA